MALLTEGGTPRHGVYKHGPPDGGRERLITASINMALLTEGGDASSRRYKHDPPDGGRTPQ